jgi:hypothetical protein
VRKFLCLLRHVTKQNKQIDGQIIGILQLWIHDDVDRLHVKIDNLNEFLVGFCFIRSIDRWVFITLFGGFCSYVRCKTFAK